MTPGSNKSSGHSGASHDAGKMKTMPLSADVAVLGAGVIGVSLALHLQARGRDVVLIDRHAGAAGETSFGNAGLI